MKKILYSILIWMVGCSLLQNTLHAQQVQTDVCKGQDVVIHVSHPAGSTLQWQSSADGITYSPITGATLDSLLIQNLQSSGYYRAEVTDLVCNPYYTPVQYVVAKEMPTVANAGPGLTASGSTIQLNGNAPLSGVGTWTVVSGAGGSFANPNFAQTLFIGTPNTTYVLAWTISNPPCPSTTDTMTVTFTTPSVPSTMCNGQTLYVHPTDNAGPTAWGCVGVVAGAGDDWNGANNTMLIVAMCNPPTAAHICDGLTAFGFSDWYLPAYNELECLRSDAANIGGFTQGGYWSSTEGTGIFTANARYRTFPSGVSGYGSKSSQHRVRCVRK